MAYLIENAWLFGISMAGFLVLYPVSLLRRDASVVDFWWGPGFGAMAAAAWISLGRPDTAAVVLLLVPLLVWSIRLGLHLGYRRVLEGHEDPRYADLRAAWEPGWAWKSFFIVFLLQSVLQGMIAAPILAGLAAALTKEVNFISYIFAFTAFFAIWIETLADLQLDRFRKSRTSSDLLTTGLRSVVRHPNYSAEILFWIAMAGLAMSVGIWWAATSPLIVWLLLRYVSGVSIIEERMSASRPGYRHYRDSVPALIPDLRALFRARGRMTTGDDNA